MPPFVGPTVVVGVGQSERRRLHSAPLCALSLSSPRHRPALVACHTPHHDRRCPPPLCVWCACVPCPPSRSLLWSCCTRGAAAAALFVLTFAMASSSSSSSSAAFPRCSTPPRYVPDRRPPRKTAREKREGEERERAHAHERERKGENTGGRCRRASDPRQGPAAPLLPLASFRHLSPALGPPGPGCCCPGPLSLPCLVALAAARHLCCAAAALVAPVAGKTPAALLP